MVNRTFLNEFILFGLKQAWACLFGGVLLALIILTKLLWKPYWPMARYDFLFCAAIFIQIMLVATKLETIQECKVILLFHIIGTIMEIFKTDMGSWGYPEANLIRIAGVPLFSGFMYSAVGSYIARVWRIMDFHFTYYPNRNLTALLCVAIYLNFFTHHFIYDCRYVLFLCIAFLYAKTWVYYRPASKPRRMPLLLGFLLVAFFIWIAENLGTFGAIWIYPSQKAAWHLVSFTKLGSWYLLMLISFVLVSLLHKKTELYSAP